MDRFLSSPWSWVLLATAVAGFTAGMWRLFRSFRTWPQAPPGRSPDAQMAESELWSTHNMDI